MYRLIIVASGCFNIVAARRVYLREDITPHSSFLNIPIMHTNAFHPSSLFADQAGGGVVSKIKDNVLHVEQTGTEGDAPFGVRFSVPKSYYYEVAYLEGEGSLTIGVVKEDEFVGGWKTKGMFYNGNVTNGSAALIVGFGPYVKPGMKVGILYIEDDDERVLRVFIDYTYVGEMFKIKSKEHYDPCVKVSGSAKYNIYTTEAPPAVKSSRPEGMFGKWKLVRITENGEVSQKTEEVVSKMDIKCDIQPADENDVSINIKVINILRTVFKKDGELYTASGTLSTRMAGPQILMDLEQYISFLLEQLTEIETPVNDEGSNDLVLKGGSFVMQFSPYEEVHVPLTDYK